MEVHSNILIFITIYMNTLYKTVPHRIRFKIYTLREYLGFYNSGNIQTVRRLIFQDTIKRDLHIKQFMVVHQMLDFQVF